MLVSSVMSRDLIVVEPDDSVECAARLLAHHNLGALPVCGIDGKLKGMVTDRDITIRAVAADVGKHATVRQVMSKSIVTVEAHAPVEEAAELMSSHKIRRLPVVNDGRVIGMISLGDIAKSSGLRMEVGRILSDISHQ